MKHIIHFLIIGLTFAVSCTSSIKNDIQVIDPCNFSWFGVDIHVDVNYHGSRMTISGHPFGTRNAISYDSLRMFVNGKEMEIVKGLRPGSGVNFYSSDMDFEIDFNDGDMPKDTLVFTIQINDSTIYDVGYINVKPLHVFWQAEELKQTLIHDKSKTLEINWGKAADSLSVIRNNDFPNSPDDPNVFFKEDFLTRDWDSTTRLSLPPSYFKIDSGQVTHLILRWNKNYYGQITNKQLCGKLVATAQREQLIKFRRTLSEGATQNGRKIGKWKIYYDIEGNEADLKEDVWYYRIIDYGITGNPPWPITDYYYRQDRKQFEGTLTQDDPDKFIGPAKFYFINGSLDQEGLFDTSGMTGEWKFYWENGKLKAKGHFKRGAETGTWQFFDQNGNLEKTETR